MTSSLSARVLYFLSTDLELRESLAEFLLPTIRSFLDLLLSSQNTVVDAEVRNITCYVLPPSPYMIALFMSLSSLIPAFPPSFPLCQLAALLVNLASVPEAAVALISNDGLAQLMRRLQLVHDIYVIKIVRNLSEYQESKDILAR